jgi:hypothetical protein
VPAFAVLPLQDGSEKLLINSLQLTTQAFKFQNKAPTSSSPEKRNPMTNRQKILLPLIKTLEATICDSQWQNNLNIQKKRSLIRPRAGLSVFGSGRP